MGHGKRPFSLFRGAVAGTRSLCATAIFMAALFWTTFNPEFENLYGTDTAVCEWSDCFTHINNTPHRFGLSASESNSGAF
jgi:hypothetical protein